MLSGNQDPTLACLVLDALVSLVLNTRKSPLISQLCLAVLHQTFPSVPIPSQFENDSGIFSVASHYGLSLMLSFLRTKAVFVRWGSIGARR